MDLPPHELVDWFYRHLLKRPADPSGLQTYGRALEELGPSRGSATLLGALLGSQEYRSLVGREQTFHPGHRLIDGKPVAHVVSLGTHCLTSSLLRKWGLRTGSLPFDWLFSSPGSVLHCLTDDFSTLLDRRHHRSLTGSRVAHEPGADHLHYLAHHGIGEMFAHRDPTDDNDYLYLERTVARFRDVVLSDDAKLFVMICRPEYDGIARFAEISARLRELTDSSGFICVQMAGPTGQIGCHAMHCLASDGDHALYRFDPSSRELGLGFDELLDELCLSRLIGQFGFSDEFLANGRAQLR